MSSLCDAQSPTFTQATDVAVSSSGQVFVGDSVDGLLYRLGSSLVQQESVALPSGGSILRLALTPDERRLVACLSNGNCITYDAKNLAKGPLRVFQGVLSSSDSVALVTAPVSGGGNSFYVGSSNGTVILIGQYGLDGTAGNVSRTSGNLFSVTASSFTRRWFGGFVAGYYTYFVVLDVSTSATRPGVRVLRVCDNSNETTVAAMYEAEINCFSLNAVDTSSVLLGASLLESFPSGGASTLVIGLSTPNFPPLSRVCTVGLPSNDSSMNSASCSHTSLPWRAATTSSLSCPNRCTISSPGAIGIPSDAPNAAYLSSSDTYTYTSTLAFNYESRALLFIAYTDDTGAFIQEVSVALNEVTLHSFLIPQSNIATTSSSLSFATWPMPGPVTRLTWTSGQSYVYAITSTSVGQ